MLVAVLIASLCLNAYLTVTLIQLRSDYRRLEEGFRELAAQNENLTRQVKSLRSLLEVVERQLDYYRNQTIYYSSLIGETGGVSGSLEGRAVVNVVAVKAIPYGFFEVRYEGVTLKAEVELREGEGRVLVNTEPRIGIDLQTSSRVAVEVAEKYTGVSLNRTDVIITVRGEEEVDVVDGPSAGLAITAAIIAAITGENLSSSVYATGTINPDGSVGPVGGVAEKAVAAAEEGATMFLVPEGQATIVVYEKKVEEPVPGFKIIRYIPKKVSLQSYLEGLGYHVKVVEVSSIWEAYSLFKPSP